MQPTDVLNESHLAAILGGLLDMEWLYFSDDEGMLYATRNQGPVWRLDDDMWTQIPATFTQLSRFRSDLRDVTPEETRRLPKPPSE